MNAEEKLHERFQQYVDHEPPLGLTVETVVADARRRSRRRRTVALASAAAAVAVIVAGAWWTGGQIGSPSSGPAGQESPAADEVSSAGMAQTLPELAAEYSGLDLKQQRLDARSWKAFPEWWIAQRSLLPEEYAEATEWHYAGQRGDRYVQVDAQYIPPDQRNAWSLEKCGRQREEIADQFPCVNRTLPGGLSAQETWTRSASKEYEETPDTSRRGYNQHRLSVSDGEFMVSVVERRLNQPMPDDVKAGYLMSSRELTDFALDPRLWFALSDPPPTPPSHAWCVAHELGAQRLCPEVPRNLKEQERIAREFREKYGSLLPPEFR